MPIWLQLVLSFISTGGVVTVLINVIHDSVKQKRQLSNANMADINKQLKQNNDLVAKLIKQHEVDQKKLDLLTEGVVLSLRNDLVVFDALKRGHINGESDEARKNCNNFLLNVFKGA